MSGWRQVTRVGMRTLGKDILWSIEPICSDKRYLTIQRRASIDFAWSRGIRILDMSAC